jgi:S1-C subfamily serine protease
MIPKRGLSWAIVLIIVIFIAPLPASRAVQVNANSEQHTFTQDDLGVTVIDDDNGVAVTKIRPDSPADAGGFREGDIIVAIDRKPVKNLKDFQSSVEQWERTRNIEFSVRRGEKKMYIAIGTDLNLI